MHPKIKSAPPPWIVNLPPGQYDIKQLIELTNLTKNSISITIKRYGAKIKKVDSGYRNLFKNVYIWKGYKNN